MNAGTYTEGNRANGDFDVEVPPATVDVAKYGRASDGEDMDFLTAILL